MWHPKSRREATSAKQRNLGQCGVHHVLRMGTQKSLGGVMLQYHYTPRYSLTPPLVLIYLHQNPSADPLHPRKEDPVVHRITKITRSYRLSLLQRPPVHTLISKFNLTEITGNHNTEGKSKSPNHRNKNNEVLKILYRR